MSQKEMTPEELEQWYKEATAEPEICPNCCEPIPACDCPNKSLDEK